MRKNVFLISVLLIYSLIIAGCGSANKSVSLDDGLLSSAAFPEKPAAPSNLRAETDESRVVLAWDMPAWEDRYPFDIYRWTAGMVPKILDSVPAGVHNYTDTSATTGYYYYYLVVTRGEGEITSAATAQIAGVVLEPLSATRPPIWARNGITPPKYDFTGDAEGQVAWSQNRAQEIRDELPWVFVDETCPQCNGTGIIAMSLRNANGLPDLTWCPNCKGTGIVTNIYPKS